MGAQRAKDELLAERAIARAPLLAIRDNIARFTEEAHHTHVRFCHRSIDPSTAYEPPCLPPSFAIAGPLIFLSHLVDR